MPDGPAFIFGIPLIARSAAYDWDVVVHHFNATLGSIFNQTDPNFRVIVACTGRPELRIPVDERLEFVDVDGPAIAPGDWESAHRDKAQRRQAVLDRLSADRSEAFVMFADADDLISDRLVHHARDVGDPHGYVVTKGYAFDAGRRCLSALPFRNGRAISFHYWCGTSHVLRLSPHDIADTGSAGSYYRQVMQKGHAEVAQRSIAIGRPLSIVPFPAVVYVRGHGSNISERPDMYPASVRQQRSHLSRLIEMNRIPTDRVRQEFALDPLLQTERTQRVPTITVTLATCRRPDGLRKLLKALRPQIEGHAERDVVVVNDGSHDDAYASIIKAAGSWIRYEALPENVGIGAARQHGAALATGDFLAVTDDDCVPPPWWLDWLTARIMASPDLDVLAGTTSLLWRTRSFFERVQAHFIIHPRPWGTIHDVVFVGANYAIRRSFLEEIGGVRPLRIGEDADLAGRAALQGARIEVDLDWRVAHEPESFRTKLRKHWGYGFANVALLEASTAPRVYANFLKARRGTHWTVARRGLRGRMKEAEGFSPRWWVRAFAAFLVSCIDAAHHEGCAAGVRARRRSAELNRSSQPA